MSRSIFSSHNRTLWSRILGIVLLAYILVEEPPAFFHPWVLEASELLGMVLLAGAAFGRVWCLIFIAGKKNDVIASEGPYSLVRNPLYCFSFIGAVGFGLAVENPILALAMAVCFFLYYTFVVRNEERYLRGKFGSAYEKYCDRTPRWIPNFKLYVEPGSILVDPRRVRLGILDAMWFIWAFFLWELLEGYRVGWS